MIAAKCMISAKGGSGAAGALLLAEVHDRDRAAAGAHGLTLALGLLDERRYLRANCGHLRRVGMQGEVLQRPARVTGTAGLDGGEHELAADLDVVLTGTPVAHPEPDRLLRQALLPEDLDGGGQRLARGVTVRGRRETLERLLAVVVHGEPAELDQRVPGATRVGELLAQGPDGVVRGLARVAGPVALRRAPPDDLGEGVEGLHVVRVLPQDGPEPSLVLGPDRHLGGHVLRPGRRWASAAQAPPDPVECSHVSSRSGAAGRRPVPMSVSASVEQHVAARR